MNKILVDVRVLGAEQIPTQDLINHYYALYYCFITTSHQVLYQLQI
jgi:hypothetical protein